MVIYPKRLIIAVRDGLYGSRPEGTNHVRGFSDRDPYNWFRVAVALGDVLS